MPSESYLADPCKVVNVDAIHAVREFMRKQLAESLQQEWLDTYNQNNVSKAYDFNANDMAQRDLKNLCLSYRTQDECIWEWKETTATTL